MSKREGLKEAQQAVSDLHHHTESLYQIIQRGDLSTADLEQADGEYESFCKVIVNIVAHLEGRNEA